MGMTAFHHHPAKAGNPRVFNMRLAEYGQANK
jgi:hypothetical protein